MVIAGVEIVALENGSKIGNSHHEGYTVWQSHYAD
jgi:hypothetical protein